MNKTREDLRRKVFAAVIEVLNKYGDGITITENTRIPYDLGMDSLDVVETEIALEERFWVTFDDEKDIKQDMTVSYLVEMVVDKVEENEKHGKTRKGEL